jgi:hypothetical protein
MTTRRRNFLLVRNWNHGIVVCVIWAVEALLDWTAEGGCPHILSMSFYSRYSYLITEGTDRNGYRL